VKSAIAFAALSLSLAACNRTDKSTAIPIDAEIRQKLPGTWSVDFIRSNGNRFESTIVVSSNGNYICEIADTRSNDVRFIDIEGTLQVKDGFLIDIITKHSMVTNGHPWTNREQIVRMNDRELVVKVEGTSFESIYRKLKK
jgi:hypothetical protein